MTLLYRILFIALAALALAPAAGATDVSMLRTWTPHNRADLRSADPVALSYLAKGWLIAGDRKRANVIVDELERRGRGAYTAGALPNLMDWSALNPAATVYTVALVQVADVYRATGRTAALRRALADLRAVPLVDGGGCYAYSVPDVAAGCIQDINGLAVALLSRTRGSYAAQLRYAQTTQLPNGSWLYWQNAAAGQPQFGQVMETAHLAWVAFSMLDSPDPAVRALGARAAGYALGPVDAADTAGFAVFAIAALKIRVGRTVEGCALARTLPGWASGYRQLNPDGSVSVKNQMWAAYVWTWSQARCR